MAAERVRLLDARTDEEWIAARIRGALHLDNRRVEGILQSWPRQLPLIIYCHLGEQAPKAAEFFISHGFTNVRWLSGGIDAWSREIDPSVRRYRLEYPPAPTEAKQTP